jgi:ribosomal protein S7
MDDVQGVVVIRAAAALEATTREQRNKVIDDALANLRKSLVVTTARTFGWDYAENVTESGRSAQ